MSLFSRCFGRGKGISILIPFRASNKVEQRTNNLRWLYRYWKEQFPRAEIIIGDDKECDKPFSKSAAINNAALKAHGDVFVIVDADGFIDAESVQFCVEEIRLARIRKYKLWFVPYRHFYRLSEKASERLLNSDPKNPEYTAVLSSDDIINDTPSDAGHWYGALIHIVPREAFEEVGGWDERFRGWGGEDYAAMQAIDTLYAHHKTTPNNALHIWHPMIGNNGIERIVSWKERLWEGQTDSSINQELGWRYNAAYGKPRIMRKLVDEWHQERWDCLHRFSV